MHGVLHGGSERVLYREESRGEQGLAANVLLGTLPNAIGLPRSPSPVPSSSCERCTVSPASCWSGTLAPVNNYEKWVPPKTPAFFFQLQMAKHENMHTSFGNCSGCLSFRRLARCVATSYNIALVIALQDQVHRYLKNLNVAFHSNHTEVSLRVGIGRATLTYWCWREAVCAVRRFLEGRRHRWGIDVLHLMRGHWLLKTKRCVNMCIIVWCCFAISTMLKHRSDEIQLQA